MLISPALRNDQTGRLSAVEICEIASAKETTRPDPTRMPMMPGREELRRGTRPGEIS